MTPNELDEAAPDVSAAMDVIQPFSANDGASSVGTGAMGDADKQGSLRIRSVNPTIGTTDGDRIAMIRGSGFVPGMKVLFGDEEAREVTFISESMLTALVPPSQAGQVDVTLRAVNGDQDDAEEQAALRGGFTFVSMPPDDGTDTDGDGLTDVQEQINGYRIRVDHFGLGMNTGHLTRYNVNSDPLNPDTDGDGLLDNEEFFANTDPRSKDTDLDGLWDHEEAKRWLTSPISIDSDGDARASDPSTDRSTIPPVFDLFDGLELYTADELTKHPDERTLKLTATSPTLDDTDGDGVSDFDEIDTPVRGPLLADMPQLLFEIVDTVDVRLDVEYAEEQGTTTAFETSFETGTSSTESSSQSNTVSSSITVGAELGLNPFGELGLSAEVTAGREQSWETTEESTVEASQTVTQLEERSRTNTETSASGSIAAGIRITNLGNITVQVIDLVHTVRQWLPNTNPDTNDSVEGTYQTLAALAPDLGPGLTLSPGSDSGVLLAIDEDVNPDRIRDLLARPEALQLQSAAYELVNEEGFNFAFIDEVTQARTARVSIDFGDGRFEEYRVATNVNRNADSSLAGITLAKALDQTIGVGNWATEVITEPCPPASLDMVTNGSFESPNAPADDIGGVPTGWTERQFSGSNSNLYARTANFLDFPPPLGSQWLAVRMDAGSLNQGAVGLYQQIGTTQAGATAYDVQFSEEALLSDSAWTNGAYTVSLWQGVPGNSGSDRLDFFNVSTGTNVAPRLITDVLVAPQSVVTPGLPLYVEISATAVYGGGSQPTTIVLIDDFQVTPENAPTAAQIEVISQIRGTSYDLNVPQFWSIFLGNNAVTGAADFGDVVLQAGDAVLLAFQQDMDGDGLYAAQEQQYGSSDNAVDTDGDGISDPNEAARAYAVGLCNAANGGWNVTVTLRDGSSTTTRVYSDPARTDADLDNLDDMAERQAGTNPNRADTDGDGLNDDVDPDPTTQAVIVFVDSAASGANTGASWDDAFLQLTDAITLVNAPGNNAGEIWVAAGNYTVTNQPMPDGVTMYGGFAGNETRLAQRIATAAANGTQLSPAAGSPIFNVTTGVSSRLDGFTLSDSTNRAINVAAPGAEISLANCFLVNNTAQINPANTQSGAHGGAIQVTQAASFVMQDCLLTNNTMETAAATPTQGGGGAVFLTDLLNLGTEFVIERCTFVGNRMTNGVGTNAFGLPGEGTYGGALLAERASVDLIDCVFRSNRMFDGSDAVFPNGLYETELHGGAVAVRFPSAEVNIERCLFESNETDVNGNIEQALLYFTRAGGAVAILDGAQANVVNSVFRRNRANMFGGALFVDSNSLARVVNSTFVENEAYLVGDPSTTTTVERLGGNQSGNYQALGGAIGSAGDTTIANSVIWDNIGSPELRTAQCCQSIVGNLSAIWQIETQISTIPLLDAGGFVYSEVEGSIVLQHSVTNTLSEVQLVNNSLFGGPSVDLIVESGNFVPISPGFVNQPGGNLRLAAGSALIDSGETLVDADGLRGGFQFLPTLDFDTSDRVFDGDGDGDARVDIGAYEFQGE